MITAYKKYSVKELKRLSDELRAYCLIAITGAGSGHPGGCLSIMDILTVLFFDKLKFNPKNPCDEERDRFFLSKGHIAPALYAVLARAGYYNMEDIMTFRQYESPFQGHPNMCKLDCMEMSSGSLGQGLGVAVGASLAAKLKNENHKIYCVMGDGEQQEGNIWESALAASQHKLDNLIAVVDNNGLQIDGCVKDIINIEPIADKYKAFGWHVIDIDGNNFDEIISAFDEARDVKEKPAVIIANTIKGKGVSFMEKKVEWHSKGLTYDQLKQALKDLNCEALPYDELLKKSKTYSEKIEKDLTSSVPKFKNNYGWNLRENMKVDMGMMNEGVFSCLKKIGADERIVIIPADSHKMLTYGFTDGYPERAKRMFNLGVAEQNMAVVAAGFAKEGFIPVIGAYSIFSPGRNWDQIRTSICLCGLNVKILGVGGLVGADGASHEGLEEINLTEPLPNMRVSIPCDKVEAEKCASENIINISGPCFIRVGRVPAPVVTDSATPYKFGTANIIRFRGEKEKFIDAFEVKLSNEYCGEKEDLCIVACGVMVGEAMRAAYILKKEFNIETRIINMHTIKPLDKEALINAAQDFELILTAEEHQKGGLGNLVAGIAAGVGKKPKVEMIGVEDEFGESGKPYELMIRFGLTAEHIVKKIKYE